MCWSFETVVNLPLLPYGIQCSRLREAIAEERLWRPLCEARWGAKTELRAWLMTGIGAEAARLKGDIGGGSPLAGRAAVLDDGRRRGSLQPSSSSSLAPLAPLTTAMPESPLNNLGLANSLLEDHRLPQTVSGDPSDDGLREANTPDIPERTATGTPSVTPGPYR